MKIEKTKENTLIEINWTIFISYDFYTIIVLLLLI